MNRTKLHVSLAVALVAMTAQAYAQTRTGQRRSSRAQASTATRTNPNTRSDAASTGAPAGGNPGPAAAVTPAANTGGSGADVVSAPVAHVDGMLRRMRVWLFSAPVGATGYGMGSLGQGHHIWALLPSCRAEDLHDPRHPCPVDRLVMEAIGGGEVRSADPVGVAPNPEARRVQSFVIPQGVPRVRIKLMGLNASVRYEAIVEAPRLADLPVPSGNATGNGFDFDFTQYPAR